MRKAIVAVTFAVVIALGLGAQAPKAALLPALSEPAVSPDGAEIAFVSGGDIWTVPATGGEARLLVAHPANESRPVYSPDGKWLAFVSTRTGNGDIYALNLAGGELRRLTWDDAPEQLDGWSRDAQWVYFSSSSHDISGMNDVFRVSLDGGTPLEVSADRYVTEFQAAPAPDGKALALVARGVAAGQWWRKGHSHLDETELWLQHDGATANYEQLLPRGAKQLWPMWTPDGRALYFMSDRSGAENLWRLKLGGQPEQITHFTSGRVLWPAMAAGGKLIAFERDFGIWTLDPQSGQAKALRITLRGAPAVPVIEHKRFSSDLSELALSPDGKKVIFIVHGEVFAASAKDGGDAVRITNTTARESQVTWAPDNKRIVYLSSREGREHIYLYDFAGEKEEQITRGDAGESAPHFSPDGKLLAFHRGIAELVVYDLTAKKEKVLAHGMFERPPLNDDKPFDFSPDSKWLAYLDYSGKMFRNVLVVPVDGGEPKAVSFIANHNSRGLTWSPDAQFLLFDTAQRTEGGQIARVDLVPHTPRFREDQFRELFKEERPPQMTPPDKTEKKAEPAPAAAKPETADEKKDAEKQDAKKPPKTEIVLADIRHRLTLLNTGLDVADHMISPDGKWLAIIARAAGQTNVYAYSIDELAKEPPVAKQLTATAGRKDAIQFTPDSKEVYYLDGGRIQHVALEEPSPKPVAVTAEMDIDFAREKTEAFEEGWRWQRDNFFDAKMNGADWQQVHDLVAPRIAAARTPDEFRRVMSLMIGELNASHSGMSRPFSENVTSTGRLGLRFDRATCEREGKLKITEVIGLSPAAIAGIQRGETLLAVEDTNLDRHTNLDQLLDYKIDRKITLTVVAADGTSRKVSLKPVRGASRRACSTATGSTATASTWPRPAAGGWATSTCSTWARARSTSSSSISTATTRCTRVW